MAFRLRIKPGKEEEYDSAHRKVWPALLAKLKEVGISKYSIFRRQQDLFLMHVDDFWLIEIQRTSNGSKKWHYSSIQSQA
jgi:L-rhamnose mutarotase